MLELLGVDFDPVAAYCRPDFLPIPVKDNKIRFLREHVACDTVAVGLMALLGKCGCLRLVAGETNWRKLGRIVLLHVNIMTRQASHARRLVTTAPLEQFNLAAVHIHRSGGIGLRQIEVLRQRFPWDIRKTGQNRRAVPGMAPGTQIHLAFARKSHGVEDGGIRLRSLGGVELDVGASRTVTFFARYAHNKPGLAVSIGGGW